MNIRHNPVNNELLALRLMNIIKDEDEMEYRFPSNDAYLKIRREDNQLWQNGKSHYVITIEGYTIYNTKIFEFKTDEINIARIVDNLEFFNTELGGYGDSMDIELMPSNSYLEYIYLHLEVDPHGVDYIDGTDVYDKVFEIRKYSKIYETLNTIYSTRLNCNALDDLAYDLFFVSLIDLDPDDYHEIDIDNTLRNISSTMYPNVDDMMHRKYDALSQRVFDSDIKVSIYNNPNNKK